VCDDTGTAVFDLIRGHGCNGSAILCAFDLLEVNGEDIRREPIEDRKRRLAGLLRLPHDGIAVNEHYEGEGATIYKHACALGCEGIVSKRFGSPYRAGRSPHWSRSKTPRRRRPSERPKRSGGDRRRSKNLCRRHKAGDTQRWSRQADRFRVVGRAVRAWRLLPSVVKIRATVKLIGGPVYPAQHIDRLDYRPTPDAVE
jgi:hypothetical protein